MNLPRDILFEIFDKFQSFRICYKNCSLVCKQWYSFLNEPQIALSLINKECHVNDIGTYRWGWRLFNFLERLTPNMTITQRVLKSALMDLFQDGSTNEFNLMTNNEENIFFESREFMKMLALGLSFSLPDH